MGDDRSSNVMGEDPGVDASPAPEPREMTGREAELAAKSLRARDLSNEPEPHPVHEDEKQGDVDRRA
ncbi:MAG TPA: hypothetical protein VF771_05325 [Longimicrobiaceae bacterium]